MKRLEMMYSDSLLEQHEMLYIYNFKAGRSILGDFFLYTRYGAASHPYKYVLTKIWSVSVKDQFLDKAIYRHNSDLLFELYLTFFFPSPRVSNLLIFPPFF